MKKPYLYYKSRVGGITRMIKFWTHNKLICTVKSLSTAVFRNTKEAPNNTKENPILTSSCNIQLINFFGCSSPRTSFLKSRRVERHPYWQNCMLMKLHAHVTVHAIFFRNAMVSIWVSFNSSGLQEYCPSIRQPCTL